MFDGAARTAWQTGKQGVSRISVDAGARMLDRRTTVRILFSLAVNEVRLLTEYDVLSVLTVQYSVPR